MQGTSSQKNQYYENNICKFMKAAEFVELHNYISADHMTEYSLL